MALMPAAIMRSVREGFAYFDLRSPVLHLIFAVGFGAGSAWLTARRGGTAEQARGSARIASGLGILVVAIQEVDAVVVAFYYALSAFVSLSISAYAADRFTRRMLRAQRSQVLQLCFRASGGRAPGGSDLPVPVSRRKHSCRTCDLWARTVLRGRRRSCDSRYGRLAGTSSCASGAGIYHRVLQRLGVAADWDCAGHREPGLRHHPGSDCCGGGLGIWSWGTRFGCQGDRHLVEIDTRIDSAIEQDCKGLSGVSPDSPCLNMLDFNWATFVSDAPVSRTRPAQRRKANHRH